MDIDTLSRVGNDFLISVQTDTDASGNPIYTVVGGQRGASHEKSREGIDASHKGSDHMISLYGRQESSLSLEGLAFDGDAGYDALNNAMDNKIQVMIQLQDQGVPVMEAPAIVTSISNEYADNDIVTASAEFTLNAPFAKITKVASSLAAAPASPSLAVGSTQQITATMTYDDASTQDVTSSAAYSSSDATVASVSTGGLITAEAAGTATITVSESGLSATVSVTVS